MIWSAFLAFFFCFLDAISANPLVGKLKSFEQKHDLEIALLIVNAKRSSLHFSYREDIAFTKRQPPGSLVKLFSAAVLLENKKQFGFSEAKPSMCKGRYLIKNGDLQKADPLRFNLPRINNQYSFRCSRRAGHGSTALTRAISSSCNVYFLRYAEKRPDIFFEKLSSRWFPDELTPSRFTQEQGSLPEDSSRLSKILSAIGEGGLVSLTPRKITQLYLSIFTGQPLREIANQKTDKGKVIAAAPIKSATRRRLLFALQEVTAAGTLQTLKAPAGDVKILGGKTGTGTLLGYRYATNGWTVLFVEKKRVPYLITVFVSRGKGSKEAADVAQIVLDHL